MNTADSRSNPLPRARRSPLRILLLVVGSLVGLCIVLAVTALLTFDWFIKRAIVEKVRESGLAEAQIGSLDIGIFRERLTIRDVKIFAEPQFGGVQILDLPELHIDYDRSAFSRHELHLKTVRIRLNELALIDGVEEKPTNMYEMVSSWPARMAAYTNQLASLTNSPAFERSQRVGNLKFAGVDRLELSIGKIRFVDMKDPTAERVANLNISRRVLTNLATVPDLVPLAVDLVIRTTLGAQPVKR
jgi:hypothetical protein